MKALIIAFMLILVLTSCGNSRKSTEKDELFINWEMIRIESRSQTIIIDRYEEYGVRDTCDFEEVKVDESTIEYRLINKGKEYFNINRQDKDSLFKYVYDIVTNPVYTEQFATCYAGNISIGFSVNNTALMCKYNSVGNWTTISPSTKILYSLLKERTEISEY